MTAPQNTPAPGPRAAAPFPWAPLLLLGFAWFLGVAVELSPAGLLGDIADGLGVSLAAAGTLTTFYALGNALLVLPLTAFALRFGRRPVLTIVMAVFVVSNVIVGLAPNLIVADLGRFLGGACYALVCTLFPAVAIRMAGPGNAAKAITVVFTATSLGTALGAPLASLAGGAVSWRLVFLVAAGLALIAGALMPFAVPNFKDSVSDKMPFLKAVRLPGVLRVAVAWALVMLAHFVVLTYIDAYLVELGVPEFVTSITLFVIGITGIIGTLLIGQISKRSVYIALVIAPTAVAAGLVVLFVGGASLAIVFTGVTLWGIGIAGSVVIYQQAILLAGRRAPETATSVGVLLAQAGFAAGSTVGGITIETLGLTRIPLVAVGFVILSIVLATTLRPTIQRAEHDEAQAHQDAPSTAPAP